MTRGASTWKITSPSRPPILLSPPRAPCRQRGLFLHSEAAQDEVYEGAADAFDVQGAFTGMPVKGCPHAYSDDPVLHGLSIQPRAELVVSLSLGNDLNEESFPFVSLDLSFGIPIVIGPGLEEGNCHLRAALANLEHQLADDQAQRLGGRVVLAVDLPRTA